MTNITLAQSYLIKCKKRLKVLGILFDEEAYSDVVREAQEIVELALKAEYEGCRIRSQNSRTGDKTSLSVRT